MLEPPLIRLAKVICCPDPARRCAGECETAKHNCYASAVAVREEYRKADRDLKE